MRPLGLWIVLMLVLGFSFIRDGSRGHRRNREFVNVNCGGSCAMIKNQIKLMEQTAAFTQESDCKSNCVKLKGTNLDNYEHRKRSILQGGRRLLVFGDIHRERTSRTLADISSSFKAQRNISSESSDVSLGLDLLLRIPPSGAVSIFGVNCSLYSSSYEGTPTPFV